MATIDYRVRLLTALLMDRGFAWLASEIIEAIERGRPTSDDQDHNVTLRRRALNAELSGNSRSKSRLVVDDSEDPPTHEDAPREQFGPEAQIRIAVDSFVHRLSAFGEMLGHSKDTLRRTFESDVRLFTEAEGEPRELDVSTSRLLSSQLLALREELFQWLISQPAREP